MAVGAVEVGLRAATTDLSETETMVTTEMAVAGSTAEVVTAVEAAAETEAVVEAVEGTDRAPIQARDTAPLLTAPP